MKLGIPKLPSFSLPYYFPLGFLYFSLVLLVVQPPVAQAVLISLEFLLLASHTQAFFLLVLRLVL